MISKVLSLENDNLSVYLYKIYTVMRLLTVGGRLVVWAMVSTVRTKKAEEMWKWRAKSSGSSGFR